MASETDTKSEDEQEKDQNKSESKTDDKNTTSDEVVTFSDAQKTELNKMLEKEKAAVLEAYKKQLQDETETQKLKDKGEYEKLLEKEKNRAIELETQLKQEQLKNIKSRIGAKYGLPNELIARLMGENEQEIEDDAKKLKKAIPESSTNDNTMGTPIGGNGSKSKAEDKEKQNTYKKHYSF